MELKKVKKLYTHIYNLYGAIKEIVLWAIILVLINTNSILNKFSMGKYTLLAFISAVFIGSIFNLMFKSGEIIIFN